MNCEDPYVARAPRYSLDLGTRVQPIYPRVYLGSGGFGDVIKGTMTGNGATVDVAIKKMRNSMDRKNFLLELRAWSKLHHPNILELLGYLEVDNTIGIVSTFIANGSAASYLSTHRTVDPSPLLRDVAEALGYLHNQKIYHGDLKGANILVSDDGHALLTDFGASKLVEDTLSTKINNYMVTLRWVCPERLKSEPHATAKGDVYSFGMTALELCTLEIPYKELNPGDYMLEILSGRLPQRPSEMNDAWWDLFESCCRYNSEERPHIGDVLQRFEDPAYKTIRSGPAETLLLSQPINSELGKVVDLIFLMEGAGAGNEYGQQILLTLTSSHIDARAAHYPLAWKILDLNGAMHQVVWTETVGFATVVQDLPDVDRPDKTCIVKRSEFAILHQNDALTSSAKLLTGSSKVGVRNKSGIPATVALCSVETVHGDQAQYFPAVELRDLDDDVFIECDSPTLLQAYLVSGYRAGQIVKPEDLRHSLFLDSRGDPQPLDISKLLSASSPTCCLKTDLSGGVILDKEASSAFQLLG